MDCKTVPPRFPSIRWYQNETHVVLTITFTLNKSNNSCTEEERTTGCEFACSSADESVKWKDTIVIINGSNTFSLHLYDRFTENESITKPLDLSNEVKLSLKKHETNKIWPRLTRDSKKLHFISVDWSKWSAEENLVEDTCEPDCSTSQGDCTQVTLPTGESVFIPPLRFFANTAGSVMKIQQGDCQAFSNTDVPCLQDMLSLTLKSPVLEFWQNCMTTAQRLYMLTTLWNLTSISERQELLHMLVNEMAEVNKELADSVKGGTRVLSDLDGSEYFKRHITLPSQWIHDFGTVFASAEKITVLGELFQHVSSDEKIIVCSTFA